MALIPPNQSVKTDAGCSPSMGRLSIRGNPDIDTPISIGPKD